MNEWYIYKRREYIPGARRDEHVASVHAETQSGALVKFFNTSPFHTRAEGVLVYYALERRVRKEST